MVYRKSMRDSAAEVHEGWCRGSPRRIMQEESMRDGAGGVHDGSCRKSP